MNTEESARTPCVERSKQLLARSDELIVPGCLVHKRNHDMLDKGYPVYARKAEGAHFWDADDNKYLDYLMGFGPIVLGHAHPAVIEAVERQMREGIVYSVGHLLELELAERILSKIPWAERLAFMIGGSGATTAAIRLARAVTGRDLVLRCGYHGWHDWTTPFVAGVPPTTRALSIEFPYNDLDTLADLLEQHGGRAAAVIVETLRFRGPEQGFLQGCIDLAHEHGALCIFDEVKTGCRIDIGGVSVREGLTPDMATYGKAWGNGLPASFVAGTEEVMTTDAAKRVWIAATFHADTLSLVAIRTVLDHLESCDGIAHQWRMGERLMAGVNAACEAGGVSYRLRGWGPMPNPENDESDNERVLDMLRRCLCRGVYLHHNHGMFLSLAHTEEDIDRTIAVVRDSLAEGSTT